MASSVLKKDGDTSKLCLGCMESETVAGICPKCGFNEADPPALFAALKPRTILNNQYLLGRVLGHGGFGITYLGWDLNLNRKLAIKEYFPRQWVSREGDSFSVSIHSQKEAESFNSGLEKFLEEARVLARFNEHPGIVSVLTFFREHNTGYFVMNYVNGITLKEYLEKHGDKLEFDAALKIIMPVMDALGEVHSTGILHRDISPDNIYITNSGSVRLLDFGAAREAVGADKSVSIILKHGFAPEEQYLSRGNQGPWTDVYALGATFYRAITGVIPPQSLGRIRNDELTPPSKLGVVIPPHAERALLKALAVNFGERFQTMKEFQAELAMGELSVAIPQHLMHAVRDNSQKKDASASSPSVGKLALEKLQDVEKHDSIKEKILKLLKPKYLVLGAAGLATVVGVIFWLNSISPGIEPALARNWKLAQKLGTTTLAVSWNIQPDGNYHIHSEFSDRGAISTSSDAQGTIWKVVSDGQQSASGKLKFAGSERLEFDGAPFAFGTSTSFSRVKLFGGESSRISPSSLTLIGSWESPFQDQGMEGKKILTVTEDGKYTLHFEAAGSGTIKAHEGAWNLNASVNNYSERGTYRVIPPMPGGTPELELIRDKLGTTRWEVVSN